MKSSKNERIQKEVAASKVPSQVVRRPIPALGLLIAAAHETACNSTDVVETKLPAPNCSPLPIRTKENQSIAMDTKFPVASKSVDRLTPEKQARVTLKTPEEYSGNLEKKHNAELKRPTLNPWSSEAYSIFEGNHIAQRISYSYSITLLFFKYFFMFSIQPSILIYFYNILCWCNCSAFFIQTQNHNAICRYMNV